MEKQDTGRGYSWLTAFCTMYYAACGAYTYLSVYLKTGPKFSNQQIGILLALGQVVASIAPLVWGYIADHSRSRNRIWMLVVAGAAISALLVPISKEFALVAAALLLANCFQSSIVSLQDSVSTELCAKNGWDLGRSRTWGTLAYALMTFAVGYFLKTDTWYFFALYSLIYGASIFMIARIPNVPGYQSKTHRVPYIKLFEDKGLVVMFIVNFLICLTTSFYYSFFSVYFISEEVGGTTGLFGICNALASVAEFPAVLLVARYIKKHGIERVMLFAMTFLALRWFLIGLVPNPYALIVINLLHGLSYAVTALCVVLYINERIRPEFRASAQGFNTMLVYGLTRVIASLCGGYLSAAFSTSSIFIVLGIIVTATTVGYAIYLAKNHAFTKQA